jgi:putative flippase GtrA
VLDSKIFKYVGAGILNTVFGYTLYAVMIFCSVSYVYSLIISTVGGVIFNYYSFGRLVFRKNSSFVVFIKYILSYSMICAVNVILMGFIMANIVASPYIAQVICIPVGIIMGWVLMNFWVYKND